MEDTTSLLTNLKNYSKMDKRLDIFLNLIEPISYLIIGALLGEEKPFEKPILWWLIGISLFAVILSLFRLSKIIYFPSKIYDHLDANLKLERITTELNNRTTINKYIDISITELNSNTCDFGDENSVICDSSLEEGIKKVLAPIISNTNHLLNCPNTQFSIFVYLNEVYSEIDGKAGYNNISINCRDNFQLAEYILNDIITDTLSKYLKDDIGSQVNKTFKEFRYLSKKIHNNSKSFKLITSPIPYICHDPNREDFAFGVLIIACDNEITEPKELNQTLLIFNRIVTNWINKYSECIYKKHNPK